ncbi:G5 domain-containing protein [Streptococcus mitis]|uniref:G5 domain-containing protein n=1 Tax=Streptococcus mitis TaxID=28037 RepID=UPI0021B7E3E5|nr:G5 domain-containing protein [Streptococcus mitis]
MKDIFNKRQRFSIRKFSVGVASVLIGIALFTPSQGVLASTENSLPSVEKREAVQPISDNQNNPSSELDTRDVPIGSTRTTEPVTSGDKENNSLTTRDFVAGEDRSSTPAVRATSNPSEVKKYELTDEYAKQIKAGVIGSEGNKLDSLLLNGPKLSPEAYTDDDYLKDKEELYIYEKGGKKYVGYNSHPLLEDTDGDGIIDSKEKPDEKLKWNVSERDMIMFMELSYRDDNYIDRVLDHTKPLTESELYKKNGDRKPRYEYMMMNKELGPYWERKKSYHTSSGLDAVLYETKSDFLYLPNGTAQVLAFRGTSDAKDIKADITLGTGGNPQQGIDAENIMRELAKDKSITNLYLTGHSLGGYLVQRAMVEAYQLAYSDSRVMSTKEQLAYRNFYNNVLKKGTTFNAPKVVTSLVSKREFWQKGLDSKKIAKSGKLTHYIVDNDSTIRKGVSNDSDVVINVGRTSGGHSSRSYFEADMINRRSEFISGKRISLDGTGYQDKKITTVKSVEKVGETAVYSKRGDDIIKSTTVSMKDPATGQITKNTLYEVFKKDGVKDKVEVETIPSPVKYEKDASREKGQDNITVPGKDGSKTTTTTYTVNSNSGEAIAHVGEPVIVNPTETIVKVAAKDKVVETPIEPAVVYEKDDTRDFGTPDEPREGAKGKSVTTTRYDVNPNNGTVTEQVGNPVVTPAGKTIVKVGAKTKVERSKDEQGREVIKTTTYEVDPKTGKVAPTTVTTYGTKKEPTVEKRVVPSPVVYEKDGTKEKGIEATTVKGEEGEDTITTTYTVDPNTGKITASEGKPVRTKEPTNTIVKVPAKDKVEVRGIPLSKRYVKDASREKGQDNITIPGKDGSKTTTTTYIVNPNNGEVAPNVGEPVIVNPTDTIIKVAAKDKVVYSKDGDNIVKEVTTYTVNPTNGNITEHTTKETFKENGLKDKVEVETIPSPVKYEKDASREKDQDNITVLGKAGSKTTTTTYTVNPTNGEAIAHVGESIIVNPTTTIVKVAAKDTVVTSKDGNNIVKTATSYTVNPDNGNIIEHTTKETFKENGLKDKVEVETIPSPVKYEKDASREKGQDNITVPGKDGSKTTTTTYTVNPDNGEVISNEVNPVIVNPTETIVKVAAKDKVVETLIEPEVEYVKDIEKDFGTPDQRTEGERGKTVTTTTYDVDPKDGHITEHVGNPVVTPAGKTIVKVGAKTKVEQTKDSEGRDVIDTTTYEVDPKTGKVTPTTVRTYGITKEPKTETRPVPSPVVYEKDDTKEKGTAPTTVKGEDGEDTITTTYTVDPNTGKITASEGQSVRTKEPTNTIVKVPAKDKVVETPIEPEVEYVKDVEKDFGTPDQRTEGERGKTVTTTTYDVDPKDGRITEHVGNPVVTPAGKTIVKVGAKTKVEQSKDSEGRDVIDTTTYEVDPKTGKVTPTTVRTYGKTKEPKVELEQDPKAGDDTATPKKQDGSTYPLGTKVEILGEDGKGKVPNSDIADVEKPGTGKITEPGKPAVEVPVENPAKVTIFENGVLPASIELPELMIEIRWIDEDGNVLKPSLKTGSEKDAEHGLISGYEFVRTVISENEPVITHIFRKVSSNTNTIPVTPDTNGNTGPDTSALTTPIPVAPVTPDANGDSGYDTATPTTPIPDEVAPNANHEDTPDAIDNGVKSSNSQTVLPNTGIESNVTLASLGLLGMLGGLGLALGKKKED